MSGGKKYRKASPYRDVKADKDCKTDNQDNHSATVAGPSGRFNYAPLNLWLTIRGIKSSGYCVATLDSDGDRTMRATNDPKIGKLYRLGFPGIAARVIEPPAGVERSSEYCYLVESLILRSRWWVNERGEPDNIYSPHLMVHRRRVASGAYVEGEVSGGKTNRKASRRAM